MSNALYIPDQNIIFEDEEIDNAPDIRVGGDMFVYNGNMQTLTLHIILNEYYDVTLGKVALKDASGIQNFTITYKGENNAIPLPYNTDGSTENQVKHGKSSQSIISCYLYIFLPFNAPMQ